MDGMGLVKLTEQVTNEIAKVAPDGDREKIAEIVREAIMEASGHAHDRVAEAAVFQCGADKDMAHKMQDALEKKRKMLVVNLMSMR